MALRAMYIWKLANIIEAEGSVLKIIEKAKRAKLGALWVKIADGTRPYPNTIGATGTKFQELITRCRANGIQVWGWHVPYCATQQIADAELANIRKLVSEFQLDGLIMDAEGGPQYFQGDKEVANQYGGGMKAIAGGQNMPLAISSNDIPQNLPNWLPRFNKIAWYADINFPQVYYGGSPSVVNRLDRAVTANAHVTIPFAPVGAAWIGDAGGCASASACAERAATFIDLVHQRGYPQYSFWHWGGAPMEFWRVLNNTPA